MGDEDSNILPTIYHTQQRGLQGTIRDLISESQGLNGDLEATTGETNAYVANGKRGYQMV